MKVTAACGCGANIVADSRGIDGSWVLDRIMKVVEEFKEAHKGCSALRPPAPSFAPLVQSPPFSPYIFTHEPKYGHAASPSPKAPPTNSPPISSENGK